MPIPVSTLTPADLIAKPIRTLSVTAGTGDDRGLVRIWEEPNPSHAYVLGADFAFGLDGRDYDAAEVLDCSVTPVRQVAEAHGRWGPDRFDLVLYALHRFYRDAFIVGEQQVGIVVLRRLWDVYQVRSMYHRRNETSQNRQFTHELGYHRTKDHAPLWNLNKALVQHEIELRSQPLIDQMAQLEWWSPKDEDGMKADDSTLKMRLSGGGSPDLVRGLEYAWHGVSERGRFMAEQQKWAETTKGAAFGHDKDFNPAARAKTQDLLAKLARR
jgi:hypothetical protein